MMHALAPMAYVKNAVSPWIRFISASPSTLQVTLFDAVISSLTDELQVVAVSFVPFNTVNLIIGWCVRIFAIQRIHRLAYRDILPQRSIGGRHLPKYPFFINRIQRGKFECSKSGLLWYSQEMLVQIHASSAFLPSSPFSQWFLDPASRVFRSYTGWSICTSNNPLRPSWPFRSLRTVRLTVRRFSFEQSKIW